jgi:hypothetical protein
MRLFEKVITPLLKMDTCGLHILRAAREISRKRLAGCG